MFDNLVTEEEEEEGRVSSSTLATAVPHSSVPGDTREDNQ